MRCLLPVCLVLIVFLTWPVQSYRILGIFPMAARSHYILGQRLMKELAARGHDVTVISPFGEKDAPKNYKDVLLTGVFEKMQEQNKAQNMWEMEDLSMVTMMMYMNWMGNTFTEQTLEHPNVQKFLKSNEKFDVVVVEQFVNDAHKGFAYHFNAPLVVFSTIGSNQWVNHLVGNPAPPSYVPDLFLSYSGKMTFMQRIANSLTCLFVYLNRILLFMPQQNKILHKYFPNAPSVDELNQNASVVLLNSHVSTNQPLPHVPNMIEIGGFHLSPPKKLPDDLQKYLDSAKEGVIYFSMGSNLKSATLPIEKREALLKAFSKLKQQVLWKWEDEILPGQPPNVKLCQWCPQQEILAHKNVKLFITHGGLLSTTETIYHGKPVIAIPIFGDQKMNAKTAVTNGYGVAISFAELTEQKLTAALNEVLSNSKYSENAKKRSQLMHDQPMKPIDTAVFWVEYAARHKNSQHFRSPALDLNWYQYLLLDVVAFLGAVVFGVVLSIVYIIKLCCCNKNKKKNVTQKKKKN